MRKCTLSFSVLLFLISNFALAQYPAIGTKAPSIKVDEFVNYDFADQDLEGKTIVLDFWYTQCAPCVASIPHLNRLADIYKNEEVVFIAITFDKREEVKSFLTKMIMIPWVGTDTSRRMIKAFGVSAFPITFVIGKEGIVKWYGSPFDLSESVLHPIINHLEYAKPGTYDLETGHQKAIFKLEVKINDMEMGGASYMHRKKEEINIFNKTLKEIISEQLRVSPMRIVTIGDNFNKPLDAILKVDDKYSTPENNEDLLLFLLQKQLNIDIKKTSKDTEVWNMVVGNDSLIRQFVSREKYGGSSSNEVEWKGTAISISDLTKVLEDQFHVLIYNDTRLKGNYNFTIPLENFEAAKNIFENKYGFKLEKRNRKMEFVTVDLTKVDLSGLGK